MRARNIVSGIGGFFEMMDSAVRVSTAVRNRVQPRTADLIKLGIDPAGFREIKLR
ncbi:hypothetical protein [Chelativorans sp. AA-79]|uniref:hypothetical protein n=1 Tax=Chelativorans sp. AA-79 TaxID=3028735 RepID=UPI0023F677F6|nr:hypothetical protein [Chelativorans sp. AA-79]WEX09260.1 hypothetical protein PVE73_25075 [Chelativorans sp. AA-79]